jgi:hypothetical protein
VAVDKQYILAELKRVSLANGGDAPGWRKFEHESGITQPEWQRHWVRWNDIVTEAGFAPKALTQAYDRTELLIKLRDFIRELGHFPVPAEFRMKARAEGFPSDKTFQRLGATKEKRAVAVLQYCRSVEGYEDVAAICAVLVPDVDLNKTLAEKPDSLKDDCVAGYVYMALLQLGRERRYKIAKAILVGRRTDQISIQLPENLTLVHSIATDDAFGIEAYWHKRFKDKNTQGEWFTLSADEIKAFKRRKFM